MFDDPLDYGRSGDALSFSDIPEKYKVSDVGKKWGITECPDCQKDTRFTYYKNSVGFGVFEEQTVMVIVCPLCRCRFHCHAWRGELQAFLKAHNPKEIYRPGHVWR